MDDTTTPQPAYAADERRTPDVLATEPETLSGDGTLTFAPRRRPSVTMVLGGVVAGAALFAGGLLVGHATWSEDTVAGGTSGAVGTGRPDGSVPADGFAPAEGDARAGGFGGMTAGEITALDGDTLTVTAADGTVTTVTTTDDTTVTVSDEAEVDALAVGDTVTVAGETGEDDSVAATAITEGSGGFGGMGGGGMPGGSAPAGDALPGGGQ